MTPTIKPSSIVHTRAKVEAMAVWHDQEAWRFSRLSGFESAERHLASAAMLRELTGGVPVSELEELIANWFDEDTGAENVSDCARQVQTLINQHRAST